MYTDPAILKGLAEDEALRTRTKLVKYLSSPAIAMMNDPILAQLSNQMLDHLRNKYESRV